MSPQRTLRKNCDNCLYIQYNGDAGALLTPWASNQSPTCKEVRQMAASDSTFFLVNVESKNYPKVFAKISPQDAELILKYKWNVVSERRGRSSAKIMYARTLDRYLPNKPMIKMHRLLMSPPDGFHVDHINGDGLDNRRENLRIVTPQENSFNSRKHRQGYSVFKGVSWSIPANKWKAYISPDRRQIHLGLFDSEIAAAQAYDAKAKELFGEYAKLNLA